MKCPICNINHYSASKAHSCYAKIDNEYGLYVILMYNFKDGATEENLKNHYPKMSIENFRRVKKQKEEMEKYYQKFIKETK